MKEKEKRAKRITRYEADKILFEFRIAVIAAFELESLPSWVNEPTILAQRSRWMTERERLHAELIKMVSK